MVVCRTSAKTRLHGGGKPAVVSLGQGKTRPWHDAGLLSSLLGALGLRLLT